LARTSALTEPGRLVYYNLIAADESLPSAFLKAKIPMIIPRKENLQGLAGVPKGSTNDTKRAVVFATMGLPLDPVSGILIVHSNGQDRLDGDAHFTFKVELDHWDRVNAVYSAGKADMDLDNMLERLKAEPAYAAIGAELERQVTDALLVYGRRFLENFVRTLQFLKTKARDIGIRDKGRGAYEFTFFLEKAR
jgi:hypothetical protein